MPNTTRLLVVASLAFALAGRADATMMVRRLSLAQVTSEAVRIVQGKVIDVQSGRDESGLPATWVTVAVERTLKGSTDAQVVVKQFGTTERLADGALIHLAGLPTYARGEEVVLFLRRPSARGFTSPVGLGQGVYRIETDGARRTVRLDTGAGKQDLDVFLATVASHSGWGR